MNEVNIHKEVLRAATTAIMHLGKTAIGREYPIYFILKQYFGLHKHFVQKLH